MPRKNANTNMLGRLIECTAEGERIALACQRITRPDERPLPITSVHRSQPAEVVGQCREDGRTWFDVNTADGIVSVMAEQIRLATARDGVNPDGTWHAPCEGSGFLPDTSDRCPCSTTTTTAPDGCPMLGSGCDHYDPATNGCRAEFDCPVSKATS